MSADFPPSAAESKLRVLVLDDEPMIATLLTDWLMDLDCEPVGPAASVKEALALIADNHLDGAILDVSLKHEQSYPAADALLGRGVPFAFATGRQPDSLEPRFTKAEVLLKPFDFDAVSRVIAAWGKPGG